MSIKFRRLLIIILMNFDSKVSEIFRMLTASHSVKIQNHVKKIQHRGFLLYDNKKMIMP
jgi:hypothetical protein